MPQPIVIAGPCLAESYEILHETATKLTSLASELEFNLYFKASFEKANRSTYHGERGPGLERVSQWFQELKESIDLAIISDIHNPSQAAPLAEVCDIIQIPAFLCRQTDLLYAALRCNKPVNIKKGQFLSPAAMVLIAKKAQLICEELGQDHEDRILLTERGTSFGYGDLIVDMRGLKIMATTGSPIIFDITHSTQTPPNQQDSTSSGANRSQAPLLARAALATGYLGGFFLETHPQPESAKSDAAAQLSLEQCEALLRQIIPMWYKFKNAREIDTKFFT